MELGHIQNYPKDDILIFALWLVFLPLIAHTFRVFQERIVNK